MFFQPQTVDLVVLTVKLKHGKNREHVNLQPAGGSEGRCSAPRPREKQNKQTENLPMLEDKIELFKEQNESEMQKKRFC